MKEPAASVARLVLPMLAVLTGCAPPGQRDVTLPPPDDASRIETQTPSEAARPVVTELAVPGFLPAVMVVPGGVGSRRLVVAAHGAGGTPEWECEYWTRLTFGQAFVLCLRGTRINPQAGFYFRNHHALDAELAAALAAARRAFPRLAPDIGLYAGFSQGASMGSLVIGKHAGDLPYAVLIEGFERWNLALARAFAERGGKAVLFACGSRECSNAADFSTRWLRQAGVRARAVHARGAGHTPLGPVEALVASNLDWLTDG